MTSVKLYRARFNDHDEGTGVKEILVDRWSDKSVWINGRRFAVRSKYEAYFATRLEAINAMRAYLTDSMEAAKKIYTRRLSYLERFERAVTREEEGV